MNRGEAIQEARRKIDDWVHRKPPALHFQRDHELPDDRGRIPAKVVAYRDKVFPIWRTTDFSSFNVATRRGAQELDAAFFDGHRLALLDAADQLLEATLEPGLPADLECGAGTAMAYGRVQEGRTGKVGVRERARNRELATGGRRCLGHLHLVAGTQPRCRTRCTLVLSSLGFRRREKAGEPAKGDEEARESSRSECEKIPCSTNVLEGRKTL